MDRHKFFVMKVAAKMWLVDNRRALKREIWRWVEEVSYLDLVLQTVSGETKEEVEG